MKNNKILIITMMLAIILVGSAFVMADLECVGQNCNFNVSITVRDLPSTVDAVWVNNHATSITLTSGSSSDHNLWFNASDGNGVGDMDNATATAYALGVGTILCEKNGTYPASNTIMFKCPFNVPFYQTSGIYTWLIDVSGINNATTYNWNMTVNPLDSINQNYNTMTWTSLPPNTNNLEADNSLTLTNTGNQPYATFTMTGHNAVGVTFADVINANQFSMSNSSGVTKISMNNNVGVSVSSLGSLLTGSSVTKDYRFYVNTGFVRADTYNQQNSWSLIASS